MNALLNVVSCVRSSKSPFAADVDDRCQPHGQQAGILWSSGTTAALAIVDLGQRADAAGSYNLFEKSTILFKEHRSPMSAKSASHASTSGRSHVWLLLLATLAYVALTFHASVALASVTQTVSPAAYSTWGDAAVSLPVQAPGPLAPCCGEQQCTTLATAGPLVPTVHDPIARSRYKAHAVALQFGSLISGTFLGSQAPVQNRPSPQYSPVYLLTARLRL